MGKSEQDLAEDSRDSSSDVIWILFWILLLWLKRPVIEALTRLLS
jgi:hypothetical protein